MTNMEKFPAEIEKSIRKRVARFLGADENGCLTGGDLRRLSAGVKTLSDYFTKRRGERPDDYLGDRELMAAYTAYFFPSNVLKVKKPLEELIRHPGTEIGKGGKIAMLDLGCGPGTASSGCLSFLFEKVIPARDELSVRIKMIDRVPENLIEANSMVREIWARYAGRFSKGSSFSLDVSVEKMDLVQLKAGSFGREKFDVIIMSNSLGELDGFGNKIEKWCEFLEMIGRFALKEKGSILVIEPALRESSRDLLGLRDEIIERRSMNVYSPCITKGRCGALANPKDWCHEGYAWEPPEIVEDIDEITGFSKSHLKYSYLLLRKDGLSVRQTCADRRGEYFRVVSDLRVMKGEKRVFLCGERGRIQTGRLDREKSDSNGCFDRLKRGDIVEILGIHEKGELFRIKRESGVRIELSVAS